MSQIKKITQCENCYKFFDENSLVTLSVRRKGVSSFWEEFWCSRCHDAINKDINFHVLDLSYKLTNLLFFNADEKTKESVNQTIRTFLASEFGVIDKKKPGSS